MKQSKILIISGIILILMFLFPPQKFERGRSVSTKWGPIYWSSMRIVRPYGYPRGINGTTLFFQYLTLMIITGIVYKLSDDNEKDN